MNDPIVVAKEDAARAAVELVRPGMVVGLGTGTTAAPAIAEIGRRLAAGQLDGIVGVATSAATARAAAGVGIPLATLDQRPDVDLTIDGADEVAPNCDVIKGGGGALLFEKIVAAASERLVIVVDPTKMVERLGMKKPLPVEVVEFGWRTHLEAMRALGGEPELRLAGDGRAFMTEAGHCIVDISFPGGIDDPPKVDAALKARPGVVETGLFLGMADQIIVGALDGAAREERHCG